MAFVPRRPQRGSPRAKHAGGPGVVRIAATARAGGERRGRARALVGVPACDGIAVRTAPTVRFGNRAGPGRKRLGTGAGAGRPAGAAITLRPTWALLNRHWSEQKRRFRLIIL